MLLYLVKMFVEDVKQLSSWLRLATAAWAAATALRALCALSHTQARRALL